MSKHCFYLVALVCGLFYSLASWSEDTLPHSRLTSASVSLQVSINHATASELAGKLSGIGLKKAEEIVKYREKYGLFTQIEQLKEVSGIGEAIYEQNRERIKL